MGLVAVWRKVRWSLQQRGMWRSVAAVPVAVWRRLRPEATAVHPFDARYGTDTGGVLGGGALAVGHRNDAHITAYAGIAPSRFGSALDRWERGLPPGERVEDFAFVDLGCGKGRALLLASEWPFRCVVGVELNPGLAAVARRNVERWRGLGCELAPVEVREGDATEIAYPEGACLVFLYNPFGPAVMREVLRHLRQKSATTRARVDVIYQNVQPETPLEGDPGVATIWSATIPLLDEAHAVDSVSSGADVTALYRLRAS